MDVDVWISSRVHQLRKTRGYTLEQLAERSGVSRSTISLIERQETSPTAAVLNKLADALGVTLASLFTPEVPAPSPVARAAGQPVWTDPASGYQRRHLSPQGGISPMELVEVCFPAGASVTFDSLSRPMRTHQQLWMLAGCMQITAEAQVWQLQAGDCLAMVLGAQTVFHNPGTTPARYLLALTTTAPSPFPEQRP